MEEILTLLREKRDGEYAIFQQKLIPTLSLDKFIGVRTPELRKLAKQLWKEKELSEKFYRELPHTYFDENQLHFFMISETKDFSECLEQVETFLPYVDNWATCDQAFPKVFLKNGQALRPHIRKWLESGETYTVRFGIGAAMRLYLEEDFDIALMEEIAGIRSQEYYVKMMIAWYFATALAKQWDAAVKILEEGRLDPWIHNKTIQKARESYRITQEQKKYLSSLKVSG